MVVGGLASQVVAVLAVGIGVSFCDASPPTTALTVQASGSSDRPLASGFLGVSFEFRGLEEYLGVNPSSLDQPFLQLLRQLSPGQSPVVRIGGDSTDWTWVAVPHVAKPGGVVYALDETWIKVAHAMAKALRAHLILGVQFEADSQPVAAAMANAFVHGIGSSAIAGLELGNEPELYPSFAWYKTPSGQKVNGRPSNYTFQSYLGDFAHIAAALPRVPLAGPSSGSLNYLKGLGAFLHAEPRVRVATVHAYPLKHCEPSSHPTVADLLAPSVSSTLAGNAGAYAAVAHKHGIPLRIDEMNSVSCGGWPPVTNSFGAALWALGQLFELDRAGVDGVNFDTVPNTFQHLIFASQSKSGRWSVSVQPEYYGLLAFAQAAPAGSRMLGISGSAPGAVQTYATLTSAGVEHVVLINTSSAAHTLHLKLAGVTGPGTLSRLTAPSLTASGSTTLGGQTINAGTGKLAGASSATTVTPSSGIYSVTVPAASAAILTLTGAPYS
jgi:hypothetical protein